MITPIERIPVKSSNLKSVGYDPESQTLEVEFKRNGAVYQYYVVSEETYNRLLGAHSIGSYFMKGINGRYSCQRV